MSFVIAPPEMVSAAATDLARIASTINDANAGAALPTSSVLAAGADEVSAAIAVVFGAHAQAYQAISAQTAQFHELTPSRRKNPRGAARAGVFASARPKG